MPLRQVVLKDMVEAVVPSPGGDARQYRVLQFSPVKVWLPQMRKDINEECGASWHQTNPRTYD